MISRHVIGHDDPGADYDLLLVFLADLEQTIFYLYAFPENQICSQYPVFEQLVTYHLHRSVGLRCFVYVAVTCACHR